MKKSFLLIALTALLTACDGNKTEVPATAGAEDAATGNAEVAESADATGSSSLSEQAAKATNAKSIIGFAAEDLKFSDIIAGVTVGEIEGQKVSITVVPTVAVDANFNAFSAALFDKLKATYGRVGDKTKAERTQPFETTGGVTTDVYSYTAGGHDVCCSLSNVGGESGKDYELIFTKH